MSMGIQILIVIVSAVLVIYLYSKLEKNDGLKTMKSRLNYVKNIKHREPLLRKFKSRLETEIQSIYSHERKTHPFNNLGGDFDKDRFNQMMGGNRNAVRELNVSATINGSVPIWGNNIEDFQVMPSGFNLPGPMGMTMLNREYVPGHTHEPFIGAEGNGGASNRVTWERGQIQSINSYFTELYKEKIILNPGEMEAIFNPVDRTLYLVVPLPINKNKSVRIFSQGIQITDFEIHEEMCIYKDLGWQATEITVIYTPINEEKPKEDNTIKLEVIDL